MKYRGNKESRGARRMKRLARPCAHNLELPRMISCFVATLCEKERETLTKKKKEKKKKGIFLCYVYASAVKASRSRVQTRLDVLYKYLQL